MTSRRMAWLFAAFFWAIFGFIAGIQVWISMITHGHSVPRLVGYYIVVWQSWLLVTALIVWLSRHWPIIPPTLSGVIIHVFTALLVAVVHGMYWLGLLILIRPYDRMTAEPSELNVAAIVFARLPLELLLYGLVLGTATAFQYYERYRERALQAARLERSLSDARLHALELQLQPHFLFNTMNAISSLVRNGRNDEAVKMMAGLSELLRYTLDHAGEQQVALEDEVAVLQRYLEIQHARFPDRMSFRIDVAPDAKRAAIPTLLLQPLAENAVRHGIAPSTAPGVVEMRAFRDGSRLRIELFNSGVLESTRHGIGLRNTLERLHHLYGDEWRFDLAAADGGVAVTLVIPWSEIAR